MKKKRDWLIYLTFSFVAVIYYLFRIKVFAWPAYLYAFGLNGSFDLREEFFVFNKDVFAYHKYFFNVFPSKKPLGYFLIYLLYKVLLFFGFSGDILQLLQHTSIIIGLFFLFFVYKTILLETKSSFFSSLATLFIAFSSVYWYEALNPAIRVSGLAFLAGSFYFLLKCSKNKKENKNFRKDFIYAVIFFSLALAFRIQAVSFVFVILYALFFFRKNIRNFIFRRYLLILLFLSFLTLLIFYILPSWFFYGFKNTVCFWKLFPHYWYNTPGGKVSFILSIYFEIRTILQSLIYGYHQEFVYFRAIFLTSFLFALVIFWKKNKTFIEKALIVWICIYFLHVIFLVNQFWDFQAQIFLLYPLVVFILLNFWKILPRNIFYLVTAIVVIALFLLNFSFDIYPKASISDDELYVVSKYSKVFKKADKIVLLMDENFHNYWYLLYKLKLPNVLFINRAYNIERISQYIDVKSGKERIIFLTNNESYAPLIMNYFAGSPKLLRYDIPMPINYATEKDYNYYDRAANNELHPNPLRRKYLIYVNFLID